jgi:hypothetical protein
VLEYIQEAETGMKYVREVEDKETKEGGVASETDHFEKRSALRRVGFNNGCRTVNVKQSHQTENPTQFRLDAAPFGYSGVQGLARRAHSSIIGRVVGSQVQRRGNDGVQGADGFSGRNGSYGGGYGTCGTHGQIGGMASRGMDAPVVQYVCDNNSLQALGGKVALIDSRGGRGGDGGRGGNGGRGGTYIFL